MLSCLSTSRWASQRKVATFLAGLLWLLGGSLHAQEYSFHNFAGSDGLGNLSIQKLYQDRSGFIWVSTENGIFRYEGSHFEQFAATQGMPDVGPVAFGEAPDGSLLVGASIGLYHLSGHAFEKLDTPFHTVNWTQGLQSDGQGHTYIATESGLFEMISQPGLVPFSFHRIYPAAGAPPQSTYGILVDAGTLWLGCDTQLCSLQDGKLKIYGVEAGLPNVPLSAVLKDHDGNLWVRARNQGVFEWPAGEPRFRRPDTPVPGSELTGTPALDRNGHILLGTAAALLIQTEKGWQTIDRRVGMRDGVFTALEDRRHSLWMGTGGRGLVQWVGYREWANYSDESGLPNNNVYEILPETDAFWAGTESGLVRGNPRVAAPKWTVVPGTAGIAVHSLQRSSSGDLWFGTASNGIGVLRAKTGKLEWMGLEQGLTAHRAFTIRFDRNHQLWAATEAGVFVAQPPYRTFVRVTDLPASWFWTIAEAPDGTIWAGGADGLFALSSGHWQHWTQSNGLTNLAVVSIGPDRDGSVWVGYQHGGGIDRVRITPTGLSIRNGVERPGSTGLIYFLDFDRSGRLWAGTERGLDIWDGAHWSHIDTTDGLVWDDCDIGGFAQAPDGSLWFGTSGGLSHFTPLPAAPSDPPPAVLFTDLQVGGKEIMATQRLSFPMSAGALVARFSAPGLLEDSSILFRYRLDRSKSPWTETSQTQLEFPRLGPGHYDLQIQVRDARGLWSPQAAEFAFSVQPPWYASGWFLLAVALAPFLGAVVIFWIRSSNARRRERLLQRIVEEKTNDLRKANEDLLRLTMIDPLTGLANRRHFDRALREECERVRRSASTVSLILIDVDHFKALNDTAGHQKGDEYLILLGQELTRIARRQIDLAARFGGEEFALVLPATAAVQAAQIAEQLRSNVEALALPHPAPLAGPVLTVSLGVATSSPQNFRSPEDLVSAADQALYAAKGVGRNRVQSAS